MINSFDQLNKNTKKKMVTNYITLYSGYNFGIKNIADLHKKILIPL